MEEQKIRKTYDRDFKVSAMRLILEKYQSVARPSHHFRSRCLDQYPTAAQWGVRYQRNESRPERGFPNLSILDGWWAEGCDHGKNGWAIGSPDSCDDEADAESLYLLLKNEVIPAFYDDRAKWAQLMRASIKTGVRFTAHRTIKEYQEKFYTHQAQEVLSNSQWDSVWNIWYFW